MSHPENTKDTHDEQVQLSALEIAQDAVECMSFEILNIRELISVLRAIDRDMDSTQHIRQLSRAGMKASELVCECLEHMSGVLKTQLAQLEISESSAETQP
ncbi:hypothetical protein L682_26770 [Aquipseudomonas alcaligenes OT 69]|nr:hypothetical protein L682_26770 [Pseudomonas alcaligenes OT 69]